MKKLFKSESCDKDEGESFYKILIKHWMMRIKIY